jgi:hypothetical protein
LVLARTACCVCALSALASCLTIEQIKARSSSAQTAAPAAAYDPRILLGPTQRVAVRRRDLENYTCGKLTMVCSAWGPSYECECQAAP